MNKQGTLVNGKVVGGIEWVKTVNADGTERQGYTWNAIAGCFHACQWKMPDGTIANCYAEDVADRVAGGAYPQGFEHHYWYPDRLSEPKRVKTPSKLFVGSMADTMGHWVPSEQIEAVIDVARSKASWHAYQFLTKNAVRYLQFDFPGNCWLGASTPPDFMWNKPLSQAQKEKMLHVTLDNLDALNERRVTWLSAEPLSWDIVPVLEAHAGAVDWIVIGAASNGRTYYPPEEAHVRRLVDWCYHKSVAVFFKGNLHSLAWAAQNWREEFPVQNAQWALLSR